MTRNGQKRGKVRRMSVKQRVILWFAAVLLLLTLLVFFILQTSSYRQANLYAVNTLHRAVEEAEQEIDWRNEQLDLNDIGDITYASVMLYDMSGRRLLYGPVPEFDAPLVAESARQVAGDSGSTWYVYDTFYPLSDTVSIWIRASLRMDSIVSVENNARNVAFAMILPLSLLGLLGGYAVTRRALRPMARMAATAERIAESGDFSARIGLANKDEFGKLSQVLDAMLSRLQGAFEQEKRFTSDASHELRTPLAVIETQCDLALREDDPEFQRESLLIIQGQAKKLSRMVRELLTLSRMDANTEKLTLERVDLSGLMEAVAEEIGSAAEEKGIAIVKSIAPGCMLEGDEMMLMRFLINLMSNAISFGKEGGHVWLSLGPDGEAGWLKGSVRDDGIGISPAELPHIFERFWQADPARSRDSGSSGLGLSMVRWIVDAHRGEIEVTSEKGKGSAFCFRFPQEAKPSP